MNVATPSRDEPADTSAPLLGYRSGIDDRADKPLLPAWIRALFGFMITFAGLTCPMLMAGAATGSIVVALITLVIAVVIASVIANDLDDADKPGRSAWAVGIWSAIASIILIIGFWAIAITHM